jgi:hypothetical protein
MMLYVIMLYYSYLYLCYSNFVASLVEMMFSVEKKRAKKEACYKERFIYKNIYIYIYICVCVCLYEAAF